MVSGIVRGGEKLGEVATLGWGLAGETACSDPPAHPWAVKARWRGGVEERYGLWIMLYYPNALTVVLINHIQQNKFVHMHFLCFAFELRIRMKYEIHMKTLYPISHVLPFYNVIRLRIKMAYSYIYKSI